MTCIHQDFNQLVVNENDLGISHVNDVMYSWEWVHTHYLPLSHLIALWENYYVPTSVQWGEIVGLPKGVKILVLPVKKTFFNLFEVAVLCA